jgi:hypothetical protein
MKSGRNIARALVAVAALIGVAHTAADGVQPYTVTISTSQETIRSGDELPIHVVLTNTGDQDLGIDRPLHTTMADCDFRIEVRGKSGLVSYEDAYRCSGHVLLGGQSYFFYVKPGEQFEEDTTLTSLYKTNRPSTAEADDLVNVSHIFDFTTPGVYVVQFLRTDVYTKEKVYVPSNKLTITVLPADAGSEAEHAHHFSIEISTPKAIIKPGDPVRINVMQTNISTDEITVPIAPDRTQATNHYSVAVVGPSGKANWTASCLGPKMKTLKPWEQSQEVGVLKEYPFNFTKPGDYEIQFFASDGDNQNPYSVKSNKIVITVAD